MTASRDMKPRYVKELDGLLLAPDLVTVVYTTVVLVKVVVAV
jgi:hypothetical protein